MDVEYKPKEYFCKFRTVTEGCMSKEISLAMENGEVFIGLDKNHKPQHKVLKDSYGTIREKKISMGRWKLCFMRCFCKVWSS